MGPPEWHIKTMQKKTVSPSMYRMGLGDLPIIGFDPHIKKDLDSRI